MTHIKRIGITLGDPGGIGPEITFKMLKRIHDIGCVPVLYGADALFNHPLISSYSTENVQLKSCFDLPSTFTIGRPDALNGRASYAFIEAAIQDCIAGELDAMVTAPICKESLAMAGIPETGHTTILKKMTKSKDVSMSFYSDPLSVVLATIHHPLSQVPTLLTQDVLHATFSNAVRFLKMMGKETPRIAIAGLNPHAGENGMFGHEEDTRIRPAMTSFAHSEFLYGPFSPDVVFRDAVNGKYDLVVAMYHDQGLIPLKLLAFETAVNVTMGLPFLRTSPDHGTAFDIAYTGKAQENSLFEAFKFAYTYGGCCGS